jgi:hypothetical protein
LEPPRAGIMARVSVIGYQFLVFSIQLPPSCLHCACGTRERNEVKRSIVEGRVSKATMFPSYLPFDCGAKNTPSAQGSDFLV